MNVPRGSGFGLRLILLGVSIVAISALSSVDVSDELLYAIRCVESNENVCAIGDNGRSIGAYQIMRGYYSDAVEFSDTLRTSGYDYTDLWGEGSEQFSESVIRAYMCRYATVSRLGRTATNEDLARIHNGGPDGWRNSNTEGYWDKVSAQLSSGSCTATPSSANRCTPSCRPGQCCQRDEGGNYRCFCLQELANSPGRYTTRPCENCSIAGIDLVFVLDSSGSIGSTDFQTIRSFVNTFVSQLEIGPTRSQVGVIVFSTSVFVQFGLTTYSNRLSLTSAVNNIQYIGDGTNTADALLLLASRGFIGARPLDQGVPRVAIVVTDGRSNDPSATASAANELRQDSSITTYAVGIGDADLTELNTIASTRNGVKLVRFISSFDADEVERLQEDLGRQTCTAYIEVEVAVAAVRRTIQRNTKVYLEYRVPSNGFTVKANVDQGNVAVCGSRSLQRPDCSYSPTYDWKLETRDYDDIFIPSNGSPNNRQRSLSKRQTVEGVNVTVYVTVEGLDLVNTFLLNTTFGDTTVPDDPNTTVIIAGSIGGALAFLLLIIVVAVIGTVLFYKRRKNTYV